MVKTTMFNGVAHPAIVIARRDGRIDVVREFGYEAVSYTHLTFLDECRD